MTPVATKKSGRAEDGDVLTAVENVKRRLPAGRDIRPVGNPGAEAPRKSRHEEAVSHRVPRCCQSESLAPRHLPLVEILIDTHAEFQELVVASTLKVLKAVLEEDRATVCGQRHAYQPARRAYRAGHAPSQVVLGGRKVVMPCPRVRRDGEEVPVPTVQAFTDRTR